MIMLNGFEDLVILILIMLWTLPWKGVALWRASRRGEKKWFIALLILNILAVLDILYIFVFSKRPAKGSVGENKKLSEPEPDLAPSTKKEEAKDKLREAIVSRGRIANNDVQILLGVSDATATNYLDELEKEGKIKQHGEIGRGVFYTPK
jgi:hypothetical protein